MITTPPRLVLLGHPVAHSLSPVFQTAALRAAEVDREYLPMDVPPAELPDVLRAFRRDGVAGNITIPHKVAAYPYFDVVTSTAQDVGAINTFWVELGALHGDNTDVGGFDAAVRRILDPTRHGTHVALLGAGGAAAAVAAATQHWPEATLTIWSRSLDRAHALAQRFSHARVESTLSHAVRDADLVVNATPIGLHDDAHPIALALLQPTAAVFDLVYRRSETAWVRAARAAGHPASDGLVMLVEQGALAFQRWFGIDPDRHAMWRSLDAHHNPPVPA